MKDEDHRTWNRSLRLRTARVVLALALGLVAISHPGTAQLSGEDPEPTLELVIGPGYEWLAPGLLRVSFELRNIGTEPLVVAQFPGLFFDVDCSTGEDGIFGSVFGGIACAGPGNFLELGPGEALLGEKVERVPEECVRNITVEGVFDTATAEARDLPARRKRIRSQSLHVDP